MIGKDVPLGTLFYLKNTHRKVPIDSINYENKKDEITIRIMSLIGMELNVNKGKYRYLQKRNIYSWY